MEINNKVQIIDLNQKLWQWFSLIILAIIWGSSFIFMKRGLESFNAIQVAAFRIFISFMILLPIAIQRYKRLKLKHIKSLLVVGFIGNAMPAFLFTTAQTQVSSSLAGMLNSMVPLFALLVGLFFYKVKVSKFNVLGVSIGLTGAIGLVFLGTGEGLSFDSYYSLYIVLATICYAFSVNEIKSKLSELDGVSIVAFAFVFIGPFAGIYLLSSDYSVALGTEHLRLNFTYIFLLALLSSVIATIIFNMLIKHTTALFASSVTYLIPVVAILWGVFDGEALNIYQFVFISVILLGVRLVNKEQLVSKLRSN